LALFGGRMLSERRLCSCSSLWSSTVELEEAECR
jgi:hypothetical protein